MLAAETIAEPGQVVPWILGTVVFVAERVDALLGVQQELAELVPSSNLGVSMFGLHLAAWPSWQLVERNASRLVAPRRLALQDQVGEPAVGVGFDFVLFSNQVPVQIWHQGKLVTVDPEWRWSMVVVLIDRLNRHCCQKLLTMKSKWTVDPLRVAVVAPKVLGCGDLVLFADLDARRLRR